MPFENFYKQFDQNDQPKPLTLVVVSILFTAYLFSVYTLGAMVFAHEEPSAENEIGAETDAERLRVADALCSNLPRPAEFYFLSRDEPIIEKGSTTVVYHFRSDRPLDETMQALTTKLTENGWQTGKTANRFKKETQTVIVSYEHFFKTYLLYCRQDRTISFAIYD